MRAGLLRTQISFETRTDTPNGSGGSTSAWVPFATGVYARFLANGEREFIEARRVVPELSHLIEIRHRANLTPQMRIRLGTRVLAIIGIRDPEERHVSLMISAKEVAPESVP